VHSVDDVVAVLRVEVLAVRGRAVVVLQLLHLLAVHVVRDHLGRVVLARVLETEASFYKMGSPLRAVF
jgi:hypothetical protein